MRDAAFEDVVELVVDSAAALALAASAAFACRQLLGGWVVAGAAAAFATAFAALRGIGRSPAMFALPHFAASPLEVPECWGELLLTDAMAVAGPEDELLLTDAMAVAGPEVELLLDDLLDQLGPDSRVVRLFEPPAMPTAGELKATIDDHLRSASNPSAPSDASQALHDALAELRKSLR